MRIQPITNSEIFRGKRKPRKDDIKALKELGAIFAVTGGVMLPPDAKPETMKKFNEVVLKNVKNTIKSAFEDIVKSS